MVGNYANPQQHYLKTQVETASPPQLLVMLFDAAVKKLHFSKKAILEKKIELAHIELTKVQKIFTELMIALDFEIGGELANQLYRIYDFVYHHLVKANIKQNAAMIDEVLPIVENLREGWTKAVEKFLAEQDGANPIKKVEAPPLESPATVEVEKPKPPVAKNFTAVSTLASSKDASPRPRLNIRG